MLLVPDVKVGFFPQPAVPDPGALVDVAALVVDVEMVVGGGCALVVETVLLPGRH
jgi:hypothetical protein